MIGRIVGAALGGVISKQQHTDPVKGAVIGAATMFVARRFLPARFATLGAAVAAGYVARKLAQRAERREAVRTLLPGPAAGKPTAIGESTAALSAAAKTDAARKRARRNDATTFALPSNDETVTPMPPPANP